VRTSVVVGDLTLAARPATPEAFAPFGRLLEPGERVQLGPRGTLLALDQAVPGPRRVTHLVRYPEARRVILPLGPPGPLLLVVLPPGERPGGPPAAFLVPGGVGVLLQQGVWHAGPVPLAEQGLAELLETSGPVDRLDRRPLRDLVGAEAARVVLPEEEAGRPQSFHLEQPNSVLVDPHLGERVRIALLALDDLQVGEADAALTDEGERLGETLRAAYGAMPLADVPGVAATRAFFQSLGLEEARVQPACEVLLEHVLQGRPLPRVNAFLDALALATLRQKVPISAYDADKLGEQVLARLGAPGETYPGAGGRRVAAEGRPVLSDREGPFGGPVGDAARTRVSTSTRRVLVALFLPPGVERAPLDAQLDDVREALRRACGGRESARYVL
jgi:DNA/RNA-binding domain of Phe-tRNA-synthetase-like protein/ureidoglycolate hydrolase